MILPVGIGPQEGGYQIERSLRFNSADSAYLSKAFTTPSNQTVWTWSNWVKRSQLGANQSLFSAFNGSGTSAALTFNFSDQFQIESGGSFVANSTAVFRDPSAFYHVVARVNGSTTTVWINNVSILTYTGGTLTAFNTSGVTHSIGRRQGGSDYYHNGYLTEVNFIDGQALAPTSFGEYNSVTGVWQPKAYTGSYGTNGFYLDFSDNSGTTSTTLGKDYSGNGNNWTPNNFSVTAGAGNDSVVDTPTPYGTDTGAGGEVRGNYATLNPLDKYNSSGTTGSPSNGNLDVSGFGDTGIAGTIAVSSGKWYWEYTVGSTGGSGQYISAGIVKSSVTDYYDGSASNGYTYDAYGYYGTNGYKASNNASVSYGATYTDGDTIGVALNLDSGTLTFYKNGTSQGTAFTGLSGEFKPLYFTRATSSTAVFNFGQRPFAYTAPSGFKALCTQNLPDPTIADGSTAMNVVLYSGNSSTQNITGVGFQPDFTWIKMRNASASHGLYDAVRGVSKRLYSDLTNAEATVSGVTSFNTDGFSLGNDSSANGTGNNYVAWNWKANGAGVSNTAGTITSTVSANTTAGFSIVTYTGTGSNATVGHGLGVAPSFAIIKRRSTSGSNWLCYHKSLTATSALYLNTTEAKQTFSDIWNNTEPTSTVMSLGTTDNCNLNGGTYVGYFFAPVSGYSAFGSYTGNGSADGPFVYTGHRPRWIMVKSSSAAVSGWVIYDTARSTYNVVTQRLFANSSAAQDTGLQFDILSNGFKVREAGGQGNDSGVTYIYAAFAENPFKYALAR